MKAIPDAYTATLEVKVTEQMTVHFEELGKLHPVYATYWMGKHFEEAGRKIILPFLEEGEAGIGSQLEVFHTGSALPDMTVTITATFERMEGRRVYCALRAVSCLGDEIGHGSTTQVILPQHKVDQNFEALRQRFEQAKQERA